MPGNTGEPLVLPGINELIGIFDQVKCSWKK